MILIVNYFLTVLSGNCDNILISASYICVAVPSKNLPQPPKNSVSPKKKKMIKLRNHIHSQKSQ